ncbi:MAG: HAMP domain-containing sensor histidine kinase [Oscillospiraceae bacterium]|nr:HAMP domain-containing sensor histidine kinase [Oscillospiraceae bacterium]
MVFYFCGLSGSLVGILLGSGLLLAAAGFVVGWQRADRRLRRLRSRLDALPEKYLIGETMDLPADPLEREYFQMMKEISRSAIGAVEQARGEKQDYCDYVDRWVHEIKTPLTACALILANGGEPAKLRRELRRADNLTETILTYAKLGTAEKDTQISRTDLRTACDPAVREEMELLIGAGISISIEGDSAVYTDGKLLVFILKQLLINCAKYCPGCQVRITLEGDSLTFEDNGVGIPAHELARVTERGFTGAAGRSHGQSTGMGLYIVSQLCKRLNISLAIESEEHCFTRFTLRLPAGKAENPAGEISQNC